MASREFIDSAGSHWLVWDTRPTTQVKLNPAFEAGWLTFECGRQLRRLAPTPQGWEMLSDQGLERLCRSATAVERRRVGPTVTRIDPATAQPRDEPQDESRA